MKLSDFATSADYCGLKLSPLIAAIHDASEGVPVTTIDDAACLQHFGCRLADLPTEPRRTVAVRGAGRGGKTSRLVSVKSLQAAWTASLPTLRRGEVASSLLIAPDLKLARQALSFCAGYVEGSRILSRALVEPPTKDSIELRRPDGKRVRIEVLAASRGGRGVRGRTLVFAGLDEAAFFFDEQSGVVNDQDIYRAVLQRVVPGGQVWIVSTPWLADVGLLEATIAKNFGTHETALVCTAGTRSLNPTWDPTGEIERDLRASDPDAAVREIDGQPMSGGAGAFFDRAAIAACIDPSLVVPQPAGAPAAFGADLGFVADSSALVGIATEEPHAVLVVEELRPKRGAPLVPSEVVGAFGDIVKSYGGREILADGHYKLAAREVLDKVGIEFRDAPGGQTGNAQMHLNAKAMIHERRVRLPDHPRLIAQLQQIAARKLPGGGVQIITPRRRGGGGHGDVAAALIKAMWLARDDGQLDMATALRLGRQNGFFSSYGIPAARKPQTPPGQPPPVKLEWRRVEPTRFREQVEPDHVRIDRAPNGSRTAAGEGPFAGQTASWRMGDQDAEIVFSPSATPEFRARLCELRIKYAV